MAFQIPASKRSIKQNRFEFKVGNKTHSIPLLKFLPVRAAELFENGKNLAGLIAAADEDATREVIRDLDGEQLEALIEAWQEASGVEVGESSASSES